MSETTVLEKPVDHEVRSDTELDQAFDEAVITLTTMLNHEIGKPLSTILSHAQILALTVGQGDAETRRRLEAIEEAARRIQQCTRDLAARSRVIHDFGDR